MGSWLRLLRVYTTMYGANVGSSEMGKPPKLPQECWTRVLGLLYSFSPARTSTISSGVAALA